MKQCIEGIVRKKGYKGAYKSVVSIFLAVIMVVGMLPLDVVFGQDSFTVASINLYRTFEDLSDSGTYGISISGSGLSKVSISYQQEASDEFIPLTNPLQGSDDYFRQFRVNPGVVVSKIRVGNKVFNINETAMPKVTSVDPKQVDIMDSGAKVTLKGQNFDTFGGDTTIKISNINLTDDFKLHNNNQVILEQDDLSKLQNGIKHITIERKTTEDGVNIITTYNQRNTFRIYESININEDDITIYPNRGRIGTEVTITLKNNKDKYSIFFLENETDPFKYENMGEEPYYPQTTDDDGIIKVKIPKALSTGKTYKVVITNNLDNVKKPGMDLTSSVTKQKTIGEFYVVDVNVGPAIAKVVPNEGTSAGSYLTIYGYRFEELKISGLKDVNDSVTSANLKIQSGGQDDPTKLRVEYETVGTYNGKNITSLTKDFLVTIGRDALFEEAHIDKNIFKQGDNQEDELYVRTKTIDENDLKDPTKDVVIEITTTITTADGDYVFTELAILPNGYTFLPSHQDPVIDKVTPDKIQLDNDSNPVTTKNTIISIQGKNFNVFRYMENGDMKTNYPKVVIGGSGESTGEIIIEKQADGKVYYTSKDSDGKLKVPVLVEDAVFEVLDTNGRIVNGIGGNEVGNSIVLTIPKGILISTTNVNKTLPLAVANPKRDSKDRGIYSFKNDIVSFITVVSSPIIEKVDPYIVTVEGGEEVVIEGRNFQDGIKVFIDGREITNVVRDIDKNTTRGTLKFKAPKGREGQNILQIMNPDGGSDTHQFIYVQTMKIDPKIITVAPNKGTKDTLVIVKGDNFLKPDQTTTDIKGLGIYKLIGTRVYLGKDDVNTYSSSLEGLEPYTAPSLDAIKLFEIERNPRTNLDELILSPYYKSAEVVDEDSKYYTINVDYEGNPTIIGKEKSYTIKLLDGSIKAIDIEGNMHEVVSETNQLKIDGNTFTVSFDYRLFSIATNEFDSKYLRVADYYDSLILKNNNNFYIIEVDDTNKVTLSDGKDNIYEIRLNEDEVVATRGSSSFVVKVNNGSIEINNEEFILNTPYFVDPITKVITGHRAKVKNKNEIWVTVPQKSVPGFYDVIVRNPDTKSFTVKNGFEYLIPQSKPTINYITPSQGSVDGGYEIVIYGEGFQNTTEVYIAGVKVPAKDVNIDKVGYKYITISVPKYPGDINTDFITDKKFVPVVVLNEDGGSANREDLFAYVIASSRPRIDSINPLKASAAGGDVVEIWGYDFRYYEPYKGEIPKAGDSNFDDLDRDGKWTNMKTEKDSPKKTLDHPIFNEYSSSPVLPKVFFGREEAKIVEFREGYIKAIIPTSSVLGVTDIYILNNDAGTSNKVKFTYEGSNPNIKSIVANVGRKQGGENVDVIGSNFKLNNINLIDKDGNPSKKSTHLVRFGEISNRQIPREADNSGLINQGNATVNLSGGLKIEHKIIDGQYKVVLSLTEEKIVYTGEYSYDSGVKYIDIKGLKDKDGNSYKGFELIKVEVAGGRLLADRGYAPQVKETFKDHLEVVTPSYYSIGNVNVVLENPDGISNKVVFEYKNPDSTPYISNIMRDGQQPQLGDNGATKIVTVNIKGGSTIVVEGRDFRDVELIQIGSLLNIESKDILENQPNKLVFKMPAVNDSSLTTLHKVVVVNDDGGTASSDATQPVPIYIQFIKGESNPAIENITPDRGPSTGGTRVTIKGKDFRETMDGYTGKKLKVYFDGKALPDSNVRVVDYRTIEVITPPGIPGTVEVKVENPDGEMTNSAGFTYMSNPKITAVVDPLDPTERAPISVISILGGQEIKLKGAGFMEGAKVYFNPKIRPAKESELDGGNIIYIEGNPYILEEGIEGTEYKWINNETVTIKTPSAKAESFGVIVVNPDGGASPIFTNLTYGLPEIAAPSGVVAELVYDRFIRVHWNGVTGATEYEIFVVIDNKTTELIGSTELTSFAYNDLKPRTSYRFIVKAVGDFGSSKPSMESNTVKTGRVVGPPDEDGGLSENTTMSKTGTTANVVIGTKDSGIGTLVIDLTRGALAGSNEVVISIPASVVVSSGNRNIQVIGKDFALQFQPSAFNVANVRENRSKTDAGVRFVIGPDSGNTQVISGNQLSTVYKLEATVYVGKTNTPIDYLASSINFALDYDMQKANLRKLNNADFNYFNPVNNTWQLVGASIKMVNGVISGEVSRLGRYTIIGSRR